MKLFPSILIAIITLNTFLSKAQNIAALNPIAVAHTTSDFGLKGSVKTMEVNAYTEISYYFDTLGKLVKEETNYGDRLYSYNAKGNLTEITYGGGEKRPTKITNDSNGNIIHVYDSEDNQRFYEYNDKNQLIVLKLGKEKDIYHKYKYDLEGRLSDVEEYGGAAIPETVRKNSYKKTETGWIVTNASTDSESGETITVTQVYNEKGDIIESKFSNLKSVTAFKFEYDEKGNYSASYLGNQKKPTEERFFTYY